VSRHRGPGRLGGRAAGVRLDLRRGELCRVRIEAEADLAAALLYERRQPIRERRGY
jgi:hypothetical protein